MVSQQVSLTLINNNTGLAIGTFTSYSFSSESLNKDQGCGSPSISHVSLTGLKVKVAKNLRKEICNAIYEDMGF